MKRIPYFGEAAVDFLKEYRHLILVGSKAPVSFFAYPDKPSWLAPEACALQMLAGNDDDIDATLEALVAAVRGRPEPTVLQREMLPEIPSGPLTAKGVAACVGNLMPEQAVISDESGTSGHYLYPLTAGAPAHDWLTLTGGSIGQGLPVATGAAIACPGRKVICFSGDGGAMYTLQSLWTQARERLDVATVIFSNRSYAILDLEFNRVGLGRPGPKAAAMLDLSNPTLDWVQLASGMGVHASRATTVEAFHAQFAAAMALPGPHLIEAVL